MSQLIRLSIILFLATVGSSLRAASEERLVINVRPVAPRFCRGHNVTVDVYLRNEGPGRLVLDTRAIGRSGQLEGIGPATRDLPPLLGWNRSGTTVEGEAVRTAISPKEVVVIPFEVPPPIVEGALDGRYLLTVDYSYQTDKPDDAAWFVGTVKSDSVAIEIVTCGEDGE